MRRRSVVPMLFALPLVMFAVVPVAATAAESCVDSPCTVLFEYTGSQDSWTVPAAIVSLSVEVAAASGSSSLATSPPPTAGTGGVVQLDLGTAFAGDTLQLLVGGVNAATAVPPDQRSNVGGGGGSYLSTPSEFLVVTGGGGGTGHFDIVGIDPISVGTDGGDGGAGVDGQDGAFESFPAAPGHGAAGSSPGAPGSGYVAGYQGSSGLAASVVAGVITPGSGGYGGHSSGNGGGGYAGGGGGSSPDGIPDPQNPQNVLEEYGSGGGGSGFLAAGLTAASTGANTGDGYIEFTYQLAAAPEPTLPATGPNATAGTAFAAVLLLAGATLIAWRSRTRWIHGRLDSIRSHD